MLPEWTVVGFSGHRTLSDPTRTAESISAVLDDVVAKYGPIVAISSVAKGSDTLFLQEVVKRKIPFVLVLPFPVLRFQQDFELHEWKVALYLMSQASQIEVVSRSESDNEAYMEAGARVVDRSDLVIATWDGKAADGLGGTGDVVRYARTLSRPLAWINSITWATVTECFDRLLVPHHTEWSSNPHLCVEKHFSELDEMATLRGPKVRHLIQRIVLLHLTASAAGLIALALEIRGPAGYAIGALEVVLLGIAFILSLMHHRKGLEWMKSRIEAEICRSFLALWPMRAKLERLPNIAIPGFYQLTRHLRLLQQLDGSPSPDLESAKSEYLENRIRNQILYFGHRGNQAQRAYRLLRITAIICTALAGLLAATHFVLSLKQVDGVLIPITEVLSLVLPLVSAALLSLVLTQEYSRRASRYREMVSMLEESARQLKAVRTWNGLTRVATDNEEQLLIEAAEWQSFRRFASDPH